MSPAGPVVDLVLRGDARTKPGGDAVQAEEYAAGLRDLGVDAEVRLLTGGDFSPRPSAVVHAFNVDRPFDLVTLSRAAAGHRLVVSTIHHDNDAVRRMRTADPVRWRRALGHLPESVRQLVAHLNELRRLPADSPAAARARWQAGLRALVTWCGLRRRVRRILDDADAVLLLSRAEERSLARDLGWSGRNGTVTPNGAPVAAVPRDGVAGERQHRILVVGRIEARKRQLEILRVAESLAVPVTFVGALNGNQAAYGSRFAAEVAASSRCTWRGTLTHTEMVDLMAASTVLLNASWAEVQSLTDLEAAASGCWVVLTEDGGSTLEHLGSGVVVRHRADDLVGAVRRADALARTPRSADAYRYHVTWASTCRQLADLYLSLSST